MPQENKPAEQGFSVESLILILRNQKVILDQDLAKLYGVETRTLIQAIKRKKGRFPNDFMFQLSSQEFLSIKAKRPNTPSWGGRRSPPYAFTELGVAMASSVLNSEKAILVNIEIMRVFVRLRHGFEGFKTLSRRIDKIEENYDKKFRIVFDAIRKMVDSEPCSRRVIGFVRDKD